MKVKTKIALGFVHYKNDFHLIENLSILMSLNKMDNYIFELIVVDNSFDFNSDVLNEYTDISFNVISGAKHNKNHTAPGSRQHAEGLNTILKFSKNSDVLIIMDPDFYVLEKNWIDNCLINMAEQSIAVFGAPWNPVYFTKYRYLPCVHFMMIDLRAVHSEDISFLDELPCKNDNIHILNFKRFIPKVIYKTILDIFIRRLKVGKSRDTGYKFYKYMLQNKLKYLSLTPAIRKDWFQEYFFGFKGFINRVLDLLCGDNYSLMPKNKSTYIIDASEDHFGGQIEKYFIGDRLYALHFRSFLRNSSIVDIEKVKALLR